MPLTPLLFKGQLYFPASPAVRQGQCNVDRSETNHIEALSPKLPTLSPMHLPPSWRSADRMQGAGDSGKNQRIEELKSLNGCWEQSQPHPGIAADLC